MGKTHWERELSDPTLDLPEDPSEEHNRVALLDPLVAEDAGQLKGAVR